MTDVPVKALPINTRRGPNLHPKMTDTKRLAYSVIQFLHDQLSSGGLSSDAQESLEVAIQCLETAFGVSTDDQSLAVCQTLPELFAAATVKLPNLVESLPKRRYYNNKVKTPSGNGCSARTYGRDSQVADTPQVQVTSEISSPTEDQLAEAEQLKNDGNDQMKVENFRAAVEFYSNAIQINPQNAVYYCNRAAAYSKLGNYAGAVQDCERAIGIDPKYSKAYGRMGLALSSLNKHHEAVIYYKKALELDPENEMYKSNLKIAEQKLKETPSPTGGMGGVDLAGLLSNPGFMNMASSLMNNPQVQQMVSGMMSGGYGPMGGTAAPTTGPPNDISGLIQAGQQFAQQMQQQNPELIEQLRSQIRSRPPSASNEEQ